MPFALLETTILTFLILTFFGRMVPVRVTVVIVVVAVVTGVALHLAGVLWWSPLP